MSAEARLSELHVAVDARFAVLDARGIGRYTRSVLSRVLRAPGTRWSFVVPGLLHGSLRRQIAAVLGVDRAAVVTAMPAGAAVLWSPSNGTDLDTAPGVRCVTTVHDATPFAYPAADMQVRARETTPFLHTAERADLVLVQSEFTAREAMHWLGIEPERVTVTPLGVDDSFSPGTAPPPAAAGGRPFVLHVGAHDARKNSATLIAAHARAFPGGEIALVCTHAPPGAPKNVVVVEAPDDTALIALYRAAAAVAVPSLYEGFGLPLLEAMACGAPALAARASALAEVGGDACAYVDAPADPDAWTEALRALLADDGARTRLRDAGPKRARAFSWEACADATLAALHG